SGRQLRQPGRQPQNVCHPVRLASFLRSAGGRGPCLSVPKAPGEGIGQDGPGMKRRATMKTQQTMEILGVVKRGEGKKRYWTRIGTAYKHRDGSLNRRFNYLPADLANTTIQVREPRAKAEDGAEAGAEP